MWQFLQMCHNEPKKLKREKKNKTTNLFHERLSILEL